jgi:hypothetical protein
MHVSYGRDFGFGSFVFFDRGKVVGVKRTFAAAVVDFRLAMAIESLLGLG